MSLPVLPDLSAVWKLRVFGEQVTNQSVDGSEANTALPDTERLAFIGDSIVHLGITIWLHERHPQHHHQRLKTTLSNLLGKKPKEWAMLYKLPSLVVRTQESKSRPSKEDLFCAYIGAVYLDRGGNHGGSAITNRWIKEIMESEEQQGHKHDEEDYYASAKESDEISGMLKSLTLPNGHPVQDAPQVSSTPVSHAHNSLSFLNEKATQKRLALDWDDTSSGLDHAKTWTSKLIVEGKEFVGIGQNKKQARGAAAEIALGALKWT